MIQRVIVSNYDEYGDPVEGVGIDSNSVLAIDVQSRLQSTIQTHNAVSVPLSGSSTQTGFTDTDGFNDVAVNLLNSVSGACQMDLFWSNDGSSIHGVETILANASGQYRSGQTSTKARYVQVKIYNLDAGSAHTMSAWLYLKA